METAAVRSRAVVVALMAAVALGCMPAAQRSPDARLTTPAGRPMAAVAAATTLPRASSDGPFGRAATGRDVTVYVFDGGVLDTHPELAGRVRRGFDAYPGDDRICNAHGTAVAGAVAGTTLGVAPDAEIVDVKMVDCRRMRGSIDAIVRAARWVLADHARHPGQRAVANWSFVADTAARVPALDAAVVELRAAGIPVVVSAGNVELDACHISPGNAPGAIVVGASRARRATERSRAAGGAGMRAPHTAFGHCIDVFAPGDSVLLPGIDSAGAPIMQFWSGTSMSAGYVSGAAARYLEVQPLASADEVREHIRARAGARPLN